MARNERKAVFAGYFNPFHVGHAYVIEECLKLNLVDRILVYVSVREKAKGRIFAGLEARRAIIKKWVKFKGLGGRVCVYEGDGKVVDFFKTHGYTQTIVGADMFGCSIERGWEQFKLVEEVVVAERPYFEIEKETVEYYTEKLHKTVRIIPGTIDVKSSDIRDYINLGAPIHGLVPKVLEQDILEVYRQLDLNR